MKNYRIKLTIGAVVLLALLLSACGGGDSGSTYPGEGYGREASKAAEYLCEEDGGVVSVAIEDEGWLDYVVCDDGTVHSWEDWEQ